MKQTAEYVKRAKEAELRANELKDESLKHEWREIANGYRNLAQARLTSSGGKTVSKQSLPQR